MFKRVDKKKTAIAAVCALAVAGVIGTALAVAGPGQAAADIAGAAPATTSHSTFRSAPGTNTSRTAGQAVASASSTTKHNVGDTEGFTLVNSSASVLIYEKLAGSAKTPTLDGTGVIPGQAWYPGQTLVFEMPQGYVTSYIGDILFEAFRPGGTNGVDEGSVDVHLNTGGGSYLAGAGATTSLSTDQGTTDGYPAIGGDTTTNILANESGGLTFGSDIGMPQNAEVGNLIQSVCQAGGNQCQYSSSGDPIPGFSDPAVLEAAYGGDNGVPGSQTGSATTENGWSTSVTNSWGTSTTAGVNLDSIVSASVQDSTGTSISTSNDFSTSDTVDNYSGKTTVIYGQYPVWETDGTITVKLGNVTWTFVDAQFTFPRTVIAGGQGIEVQYSPAWIVGDNVPSIDPGVHS